MIRPFCGKAPRIDPTVYVAPTATIIGDVEIGPHSSIWFGAVLRGDVFYIRIGAETSVQDNSVIHVTHDRFPTIIGSRVTIGHAVTLHGCTIADLCIIGMGSTVLDQAEIGERSIVGAGALVTPGTRIPPGHLAVGAPARVKRALTDDELRWLESSAAHYVELGRIYREEGDG
ncbi:MAG: gamma carbonic anhydrase family protein [Myxococcales bacterium]|nr:gamma carbonic anhydrase family protein [Myxococcota bacterium]MDW8283411.1 gamma carbonic anhydrase family protein [Myxococcales bacterium]